MTHNSDNREKSRDALYIKNALTSIDQRIVLPDSLRADLLCEKLEDVYPDHPPAPNMKSGFRLPAGLFSWHSTLSYAAAFVLVVALFYTLDFSRPELVGGNIAMDEQEVASPFTAVPGDEQESAEAPASEDAVIPAMPEIRSAAIPQTADVQPPESADVGGVGGSGVSVPLGEYDIYAYALRQNDQYDPDKDDALFTLEVLDNESHKLVSQINLNYISDMPEYYVQEQIISFVGTSDTGTVICSYDLTNAEEPVLRETVLQPGKYIASRVYNGVVHAVSLCESKDELDCEIIQIEGSDSEQTCVITALDMQAGAISQTAFAGATDDIKLYNLNAYLSYPAEDEEGNPIIRIAQIRLNGTEVELGANS